MDSYGFEAKVIEHSSTSRHSVELVTLQLRYPRFIHAEFLTHRAFSRNSSSSRAIPVAKMIEQVRNDPAMPVQWGKNQPGMQAREELRGDERMAALCRWRDAGFKAAYEAEWLAKTGAHKQIVNRILEPFQWMHTVVTATEWDNFFALRDHPDAQPEIQHLAKLMRAAIAKSNPDDRAASGWHLPYITDAEREEWSVAPHRLASMSAARCARVSYLKHDGTAPSEEDDIALFRRLVGSKPIHASPTEHQAYPVSQGLSPGMCNNFRGWAQFRSVVELAGYE